jgi:hypothetical protein
MARASIAVSRRSIRSAGHEQPDEGPPLLLDCAVGHYGPRCIRGLWPTLAGAIVSTATIGAPMVTNFTRFRC